MTKERTRKYHAGNLFPMLRLAATLRNQMIAAGFTDNGGAIHSAERILNILGMHLKYPTLTHINNLRTMENARFSVEAFAAHGRGEKVLIEHVSPLRDLTRKIIEKIDHGMTDSELEGFINTHYELVLLTADETVRLNRLNRSKMEPNRLALAEISLISLDSN